MHTKMAKVMQDFKFCMKTEQNLEDKGTLSWFSTILGFDWASNDPNKIKKSGFYERHDQLFMDIATEYLCNALENYLKKFPESLQTVTNEDTAVTFILKFLSDAKIEFFFQEARTEDDTADHLTTYCRDMCSRLVLSLIMDRCEKQEDPLGLRGIRRMLIPYFLNRKNTVQDSKVSEFRNQRWKSF